MISDKDFLKFFYDSEDMPTKKELEEIIDDEKKVKKRWTQILLNTVLMS